MLLNLSLLVSSKQIILLRQLLYYMKLCPKFIYFGIITKYTLQLYIKRTFLVIFLRVLSKHWYSQYKTILDIVCLDFFQNINRFTLYYLLLSYKYMNRLDLLLNVRVMSSIQSISFLYIGALWLEREVWDMFGVYFQDNLDLRRILTDYGFLGYPLRKDFPLSGFLEISYDDRKKSIIYKKNSFSQEFRNFYKVSSWR